MKNCGRAAGSSAQRPADRAVSDRLTLLQAGTASAAQKAQDIALTKLDVLGAFDKIPVITGYRLHGVLLDSFPTDSRLEEAEPVIEELPGLGMRYFRLQKLEGSAGKCQKICVYTGETRGSSDLSGIYGSREGCVPAA